MRINGPTLKGLREASGLSQVALSAATGGVVSQGRISELEAGDKGRGGAPVSVRPETAKALAVALGLPIVALVVPESEPVAS